MNLRVLASVPSVDLLFAPLGGQRGIAPGLYPAYRVS